jgi:hypothetical protein
VSAHRAAGIADQEVSAARGIAAGFPDQEIAAAPGSVAPISVSW